LTSNKFSDTLIDIERGVFYMIITLIGKFPNPSEAEVQTREMMQKGGKELSLKFKTFRPKEQGYWAAGIKIR